MTFIYRHSERVDTRRDTLALGFVTSQSDAILVSVVSANSMDYLEIEIVIDLALWCIIISILV